jgi:hypothetical protein
MDGAFRNLRRFEMFKTGAELDEPLLLGES